MLHGVASNLEGQTDLVQVDVGKMEQLIRYFLFAAVLKSSSDLVGCLARGLAVLFPTVPTGTSSSCLSVLLA